MLLVMSVSLYAWKVTPFTPLWMLDTRSCLVCLRVPSGKVKASFAHSKALRAGWFELVGGRGKRGRISGVFDHDCDDDHDHDWWLVRFIIFGHFRKTAMYDYVPVESHRVPSGN